MLKLNEKYRIRELVISGIIDSRDRQNWISSSLYEELIAYWEDNYIEDYKKWLYDFENGSVLKGYKPQYLYEIIYNEDIAKIIAIGKLQNA